MAFRAVVHPAAHKPGLEWEQSYRFRSVFREGCLPGRNYLDWTRYRQLLLPGEVFSLQEIALIDLPAALQTFDLFPHLDFLEAIRPEAGPIRFRKVFARRVVGLD